MLNSKINSTSMEIADAIPGGFFIYHADGDEELIYANKEVIYIFGCKTLSEFRELTQNSFKGIVHPDDLEKTEESIARQIDNDERNYDHVEYRIIRKDGSVRWIDDYGHLIEDEEYGDIFFVFVSDITKEKMKDISKEENAYRKEEVYHRALIADAISYYEMNLTKNEMERSVVRAIDDSEISLLEILGLQEKCSYTDFIKIWTQKMMTDSVDEEKFLCTADRIRLLKEFEEGKEEHTLNFWTRNILGDKIYVRQHYQLSKDNFTGEVHALVTVKDATASKKQQELVEMALAQAEAASSVKRNFLANMSHDIRTPLNAIIGFATLVEMKAQTLESAKEYNSKILAASKHLLAVLNDVFDMQQMESGKMKLRIVECNLSEILQEVKIMLRERVRKKKLNFFIDSCDIRNQYVLCDRKRLTQVLIKLLENAVKYTPENGTVVLKVEEKKGVIPERPEYEFCVIDTGIGISPDKMDRLFVPFKKEDGEWSVKKKGTGLGLSLVKNIVELMGGYVKADSRIEKGTTFTITIPMHKTEGKRARVHLDELKGMHALVVDDDYQNCERVLSMLNQIGIRADGALSGREAILKAKQAVECGKKYDLYILDWVMPDINGVEVAKKIRREIGGKVPVIVLTAYDWSDIEDEALYAGVNDFCMKPMFMSDLQDCLSRTFYSEKKKTEQIVEHPRKERKILLVEDNEINQEIAAELLEQAGFFVDVADHGAMALEMIKEKQDDYDLVFMDIQMPVMDGYTATRKIRELENKKIAKIPIVALTANAFEEDKVSAIEAGMDDYLAKPIQINELLKKIDKFLK